MTDAQRSHIRQFAFERAFEIAKRGAYGKQLDVRKVIEAAREIEAYLVDTAQAQTVAADV